MKIKLGISLILAFFVFIFISQNTETVSVAFLAWSVQMSLVLLAFMMLGAGIIIGWLLNSYLRFVRSRKQMKPQTSMQVKSDAVKDEDVSYSQGDKKARA